MNCPISIIGHSAQFARRGPNVGIQPLDALSPRPHGSNCPQSALYHDAGRLLFDGPRWTQYILLEIDPTDIEYQLRTIQIDHLPGCRLETFRVHTGRNEHFDPKSSPTISETIPRKGRIDTKIVGRSSAGRDAQPLKDSRYYQRKYGDFSKHRQIYLPANLLKINDIRTNCPHPYQRSIGPQHYKTFLHRAYFAFGKTQRNHG